MAEEELNYPGEQIKKIDEGKDDEEKILKQKYRHVFINNPLGREVLMDILLSFCHYGQFLEFTQKEIAEYNVGVSILLRCEILDGENIQKSLSGLFNS